MNLFTGDRGLLSYFDKKELEQNLNERKISITQKVSNLENKNLLLSENLNFDYVDTLIRDKLKYGNKGEILESPVIYFKGLPIIENDKFRDNLKDTVENIIKTFSLKNVKQDENLIETLKIGCRKLTKEKTGKKPVTNINLVRI